MSERHKYRLEKQETLSDWKARAEKAETERDELKAEVERLNGLLDWMEEKSLHKLTKPWKIFFKIWKAQKEGE